ncbi:DNAJ domain protein [Dionaea muscipula]
MGGLCSRSATVENVPSSNYSQFNGHHSSGSGLVLECHSLPGKGNDNSISSSVGEVVDKQLQDPFSFHVSPYIMNSNPDGMSLDDINDGIPRLSREFSYKWRSTRSSEVAVAKVSGISSLLGKAGTAGLGKAVEVLDTLGSGMTSLSISGGFVSGVSTKGNKIKILSFEVANTIVKGSNLMQSLSKENIKYLKEVVLQSEGVQNLISKDVDELLRIAAFDKREELKVFTVEVVRFGNSCKDPQWHNLDRYFDKLTSELTPQKQLQEEAEIVMQQLMTLVQNTADLYHELHALDRFEQDYKRKLQEEVNPGVTQRGDGLAPLWAELKSQRKHVRSLKKKSLWSRILEEVIEKLVDIVHFLHLEIHEAFGDADDGRPVKSSSNNHIKLGSAGLALHYANIITQIDTLVSRSNSVPPNTRDALYQGLPPAVKSALRSKLQSFELKEELTIPQIKAEMEKTLHWLVPIATNTTKAHHGFGWVGEWANTGADLSKSSGQNNNLLRIETLHHADKEKTEGYVLDMIVWLHHLISQSKLAAAAGSNGNGNGNGNGGGIRSPSPIKSPPMRSPPNQKTTQLISPPPPPPPPPQKPPTVLLTVEDQEMLQDVTKRRKLTPGISKSQEFDTTTTTSSKRRLSKYRRPSKSSSLSPTRERERERSSSSSSKEMYSISTSRRPSSSIPVIDFDIDRIKALDVIDRVDTLRSLQ